MTLRGERADEVAVDLEVVERQVLQVVEGGEAGAEVVEREAAAEPGQALREGAGLLHVGDRGGLGDLEHEAARIDAGERDLALHELRDRQVAHRLARDVDLEAHVVLGEQVDRLARHPLVDLLDQAEALRGVDEGGGHDDLAVVADHAQQQLVLGDRVAARAP